MKDGMDRTGKSKWNQIGIYIFKTFHSFNPHLVFLSSPGGENKVQPLVYRGREQPRNLGNSGAHFWFLVQFASVNTLLLRPNELKKVAILFPEGAFLFMFIPLVCLMYSIPLPGQPFPVAAVNCQQHLPSHRGAEPCWPSPPLDAHQHGPSIWLPLPFLSPCFGLHPLWHSYLGESFLWFLVIQALLSSMRRRILFRWVREPMSGSILDGMKLGYRDR